MPDLLLELFSEEIPARMQANAAEDLKKLVTNALVDRGLTYESAGAFATPRRLALHIAGLPARQPDVHEDIKGPRVGAPEQALTGFLKKAGLASIDEAKIESDGKKGEIYIARIHRAGQATLNVLADILPGIIRTFPWPKSMRWGVTSDKPDTLRWVRPLHSILCTFGPETEETEIVPFEVGGISASNITYGHRFMAPAPIKVRRFSDYVASLEKAKVILDPARRREIILNDAKTLAHAQNLELIEDDGLLAEVAGLVEWPVVLMGSFDSSFLDIPGEVVRATIRANQKCFVLRGANGKLAPNFLLTANILASDGGKAIAAGNGRVVRARLSDALYFWATDQADLPDFKTGKPLDQRLAKLRALNIVFHEKLGSQGERIDRIVALAQQIAPLVWADPAKARRAAELAKADLVTEVVGEFPEVQGLMGRRYAELQGEDADVSAAIEEHYKPQGPSDFVPKNPVSVAVALADKLDTLVGFWAIDEKPTGSKDPFALRRAALGVIRLVLENGLKVDLNSCIRWSVLTFILSLAQGNSQDGYRNLGTPFDGVEEDGPKKKWSEPPFKFLLNYDKFVDDQGASAEHAQSSYVGLEPEHDEADAKLQLEASIAYAELQSRLERLDMLVGASYFTVDGDLSSISVIEQVPDYELTYHLPAKVLAADLLAFFHDRLKVYLRDQGIRHDIIDAVISPEADDLLAIKNRAVALQAFFDTDDGKNLLAGYKRAANILKAEEKKAPAEAASYAQPWHVNYLRDHAEKVLGAALDRAASETQTRVSAEDYTGAMQALSKLRAPTDAFFTEVTVNDEQKDLRLNRLRMLSSLRAAVHTVADFSKIAG